MQFLVTFDTYLRSISTNHSCYGLYPIKVLSFNFQFNPINAPDLHTDRQSSKKRFNGLSIFVD